MNLILSGAWCGAGEARRRSCLQMKMALTIKSSQPQGFTLLELLVAVTVAAVLTTVSLNAYGMFHHAVAETSLHYGNFAGKQVQDLRCRTRFVRGLSPCLDTLNSHQIIFKSKKNFCPRF